jgi:hypothetical protein
MVVLALLLSMHYGTDVRLGIGENVLNFKIAL